MMEGQVKDKMAEVTQMSAERMQNLICSLNVTNNSTFSNFHFNVQHLELDLSYSPIDKPWESFFACILQKLLGCIDCDDLEGVVQQAGKSWAKLQVKINEIIRNSSAILQEAITCEEISKTIQNRSTKIQTYIKDFLKFLQSQFNTDVKLSFFDWRTATLTHFQYAYPKKSGTKEHVILVADPDLKCFRLLIPLFRPDSSIDDYFEELFNQMVQKQEMRPYFIKQFEKLSTADFQPWIESQFEMFEQVTSVPEFPQILLQNYDEVIPSSKFPLLAKYFDYVQPSTKNEILHSLKWHCILTVEDASKVVLETRLAEHKDEVLKRIEKENDLIQQSNQLERDYENAKKQKRQHELELKKYRENLESDTATKRRQEELIRQREQDIATTDEALKQKRCHLTWNIFRKQLMEVQFSYKTLKQVNKVHTASTTSLLELCNDILTELSLPFFANPVEKENLLYYAANNDEPEAKAEITDVLTFLFQPPKIAFNANKNETLLVTGRHLIISEVLESITKYSIKELRLVAGLTIFFDADLPQDRFHGISIVMSAPTIEVVGMVTINTSGSPGSPQSKPLKAPDGECSGRNGTDGEDGAAGESAGHVYLQTSKWELSRNLTIIANGGDGGFGQDGGDGKDGDAGRDGIDGDANTNWKSQPDWNKYIDRGTKGDRGDKGGDGGRAGLGGGGGEKGIVFTSENFYGNFQTKDGCQGEDGKAGSGGRGGQGGYDGVDDGFAWHNYSFMFGEYTYARGELDVRKQNVWYGGKGWDLIPRRNETEVKSCQACSGGDGISGKDSSSRASQRNKTCTINEVSKNEIFDLSKAVRSAYNDLKHLKNDSDQLHEIQKSVTETLKFDTISSNDEIDANNELQEDMHYTEELKTKLKSKMDGSKNQQLEVRQKLEQVASEKVDLNLAINTTKEVVNQLSTTFHRQFKLQNKVQQQIQATLTTEFSTTESQEPVTSQHIISDDNQVNRNAWLAQYKDNPTIIPKEVLPAVLAYRFPNEELARAFEVSLQYVISNHTLSPTVKGFIDKVINYLRSESSSSRLRYSKNYLVADINIVILTETWSTEDRNEAREIFLLDENHKCDSVGEFLIHLRSTKDFLHPGYIQTFQDKIEALIVSKQNISDTAKILLNHLSILMVDFMEVVLLEECKKRFLKLGIHESPEITPTLSKVRSIYLEAKEYLPKLNLRETYHIFFGVVTSSDQNKLDIWNEFVLVTTELKSRSYLSAVNSVKTDLQLIQDAFDALVEPLTQLSSTAGVVLHKLKVLSIALRYLNLQTDDLQKLFTKCDEISCLILYPYKNIFQEFQNVQKIIVENFLNNHLQPVQSNIEDYVKGTFRRKTMTQILNKLASVSDLFGTSKCHGVSFTSWFECLQKYDKGVRDLVNLEDITQQLEDLITQQKMDVLSKIDEFYVSPPQNTSGTSGSISLTQTVFNAGLSVVNFRNIFSGNSKLQKHIPEIIHIVKLLRKETSWGLAFQDFRLEMFTVEDELKTFLQTSPDFRKIYLIEQELERFQLYVKAQSIWKIQFNVTALLQIRKNWMTDFDKKIAEIVKLVKERIENSNVVLHQQEILMCLKMHLIKIVNGRQVSKYGDYFKPEVINVVLDDIKKNVRFMCNECKPEELIAEAEKWLNKETSLLTDSLCLTLVEFKPDKNVKLTDLMEYILKRLEEFMKSPSTLPQLIEILEISCQVLLHCCDIELNVFSDISSKATAPQFPELHTCIKNVSQDYLQDNSQLAQLLKQLDFLVTAHENSEFSKLFQAILSSRQTVFEDLEQKVEFLLERFQDNLENIFEAHRGCSENTLVWLTPVRHYSDSIAKYIFSDIEKATLASCDMALSQLYLYSLLEFPCLHDKKTPSTVRKSISKLKSTNDCQQYQNIFNSISLSRKVELWGLPVLLVIQRLIDIPSEDIRTCWHIHSLVAEIERLAKYVKGTKEQTVLETIALKLTALSHQFLSKLATERELLDKAHSTISMVSLRRGIIPQSVLRCQLYKEFEAYFYLHTSEKSIVNFYDETILPIIDTEVVDIFGSKIPTSTIQEHLTNLVNSDAEHFSHRNTKILGLVILNYNLNKLETDFCNAIVDCGKSLNMTLEHKDGLTRFIQSNNPTETNVNPRENRLIKIFLDEVNVEKENLNLPFLNATHMSYLQIMIRSVKTSRLPEVTAKIKEILTHSCMTKWESSFKELVKNVIFLRFLDYYVPEDFLKNLKDVGQKIMEKLSGEFHTFRSSYKEVPQNAEKMELTSKQFDRQSNTDTRLELKVYEMIRFKHFFNRHFYFKEEKEEIEIFQSFELLLQRFLVYHVPFEEFNDLFYRLIELSSKNLIQIVGKYSAFELMEGILIEIVTKNFKALSEKKGNMDSSEVCFDIEKCLVQWKENGSAKRKLIAILADSILQEVECISGSTTIDVDTVRRAVEFIREFRITTGLVNDLHKCPLSNWGRKTHQYQLLQTFSSKTVDAILKFEDKYGLVTNKLLEICSGQPESEIFAFLNNFNTCRWDAPICQLIEQESNFAKLRLRCVNYSKGNVKRNIKEIVRMMRENPKNCNFGCYLDAVPVNEPEEETGTNSVVRENLENCIEAIHGKTNRGSEIAADVKSSSIDPNQTLVQQLKGMGSYIMGEVQTFIAESEVDLDPDIIFRWDESRIKKWACLIFSVKDKNERTKMVKKHLSEVLAVIWRGVFITRERYTNEGYYPRDTQLVSVWLLIQQSFKQKGCLAEIQTGEGKTLVVAMAVIVRVLCGDDVDVITSSSVLAQENLKDIQKLYELFGVTAATNCDLEAERDEKVRKKRYNSKVIYGDVGSFQRDILLTNFFDRGITMGRTTDIVFVDEVDSMLLDKGENILYLSHNIQDLRSLWPIFVEIWNAVHAPDVFRGRPEDVVMVARFVKTRIQKGDIFFPNSLQKFINEKLVVWIQNAFLAMNMKENDPYILSDVNKKGPTIVIMDKDTGVEQVNMNWSNGLHQFIQLKHTDRLTSESLKAVFMSNICYFRKFKGKLFGITGTLGSTTERELLSKCYDVDFYAVPRFQARRCIEDEGYVLPDEATWIKKIQEIVHEKCLRDRAVLIICENVDSVDKLVQALQPLHSKMVSAYKSSFDEDFRKEKESLPLDCGNILAATNIAGRGTDWKTTNKVQNAGGLHVILSYMPGNVRIEEQAFGRTARNGLAGSVQYVVIHEGTDETTVNTLRRERDENESKRLDNFRIKSIPRIEIEEKLCERFHQTLKTVQDKLNEKDKDVEKLHMENLKNMWAMWLDSMSERLKLVHVDEEPILASFEKFKEDMLSRASSSSKFESGPVELIKLGRLYERKKKFVQAKTYFDRAINSEPNFCEVAHYYKAATILKEESSKMDAKRQAIHHLKSSHRLLKKRINQLMTSAKTLQMTDNIRRQDGKGTMSNRYEKQVENECELYQVHCGKIEEAIGAPVTSLTLKSMRFVIDENESNEIFEVLRKNSNVCKNYRLSKKVKFNEEGGITTDNTTYQWPHIFMYCKSFVIEFLKKSLEDGIRSSRHMEEDAFCGVFQNAITTRHKFWNFLIQNNVLINNRIEKLIIVRSSEPEKFRTVMLPEELKDYRSILETILRKFDKDSSGIYR